MQFVDSVSDTTENIF